MMEDTVKTELIIKEEPIEEYEDIYDDFQSSVNNELPTCLSPLLVLLPEFDENSEEGPGGEAAVFPEERDLFAEDALNEAQVGPVQVKREATGTAQSLVCQTSSDAVGGRRVCKQNQQTTENLKNHLDSTAANVDYLGNEERSVSMEGAATAVDSVHRLLSASELPAGAAAGFYCACGKVYVHKTSLYGHVRVCTSKLNRTGNSGGSVQLPDRRSNGDSRAPVRGRGSRGWKGNGGRNIRGRGSAPGVLHMALQNSKLNAPKNAHYCACGKVYRSRRGLKRHVRVQLKRISAYTNRTEESATQPRQSSDAAGNGTNNKEQSQTSALSILETLLRGEVDRQLCNSMEGNVLQHVGVAPNNKQPPVSDKAQANPVPVDKESVQGNENHRDARQIGVDDASKGVCSPPKAPVVEIPGVSRFRCYCGESFGKIGNLLTHLLTHSEEERHRAPHTGAAPPRKEPSLNTCKSVAESNHQCDLCDQSFPKLSLLVLHKLRHAKKSSAKQHENRATEESSGSEEDTSVDVDPIELVENVSAPEDKNHQCGSCGRSFREFTNLLSHMCCNRNVVSGKLKTVNAETENEICDLEHSVNNEKNVCECDTCGQSFRELSQLLTHKQRCHSSKTSGRQKTGRDKSEKERGDVVEHNKNDGEHMCGICGRSFKALSHLLTHIRFHTKIRSKQKKVTNCNKDAESKVGGSDSRNVDSIEPVKKMPMSVGRINSLLSSRVKNEGLKNVRSAPNNLTSTSIYKPLENVRSKQLHIPSPPVVPAFPGKEFVEDRTERYCGKKKREMTDLEMKDEDTNTVASNASKTSCERSLTAVRCKDRCFPCECGAEFRSSLALANHSNVHLKKPEYICNTCGKVFTQKVVLVWHLRFHKYQKEYKCIKCDASFARHNEFVAHKRLHRFRVPCCVCRKILQQSTCGRLQTRSLSPHRRYFCTNCAGTSHKKVRTTTFGRLANLRQTSVALRSTSSSSSPTADDRGGDADGTLKTCSLCNKMFTKTSSYQQHMSSHLADCAVLVKCMETVPKKKNDGHEKGAETKNDNLQHCKKNAQGSMEKSKQVPEKKKKEFRCKCGMTFRFLSSVTRHLCKLKGHECNVCNKVFRRKGSLDDHMRLHTGKKKYHCSVCLEQFSRFRELERHKRLHTDQVTPDVTDRQDKRQLASSESVESSREVTLSNDDQKTSRYVKSHGNSYVDETISGSVREQPTKRQRLLSKANENSKSNLEGAEDQMTMKSNIKSSTQVKKPMQNSSGKQSNEMLHLFSKVSVISETGVISKTERITSNSLEHAACAEKSTTDANGEQPSWIDMNSEDNTVAEEEEEEKERKGQSGDNNDDDGKAVRCDLQLDKHHNSKAVVTDLVSKQPTKISSALIADSRSDMNVGDNPNASLVSKPLNHGFIKSTSGDQINIHKNTTESLRIKLDMNTENEEVDEDNNDEDNDNDQKAKSSDFKGGEKQSSQEATVEFITEQSSEIRKLYSTLDGKGDDPNVVYLSKSSSRSFVEEATSDSDGKHRNTKELSLSTPGMNSEENPIIGGEAEEEEDDDDDDDDDSDNSHMETSCDPNLDKSRNIKESAVDIVSEHRSKSLVLPLESDEDFHSDMKRSEKKNTIHHSEHDHSFITKAPIDQINIHQNTIKSSPSRPNSDEEKRTESNHDFDRVVLKKHKIHHIDEAPVDSVCEQPKKKLHLSLELDEIFNSDAETRDKRHTIASVYKREMQNQVRNTSELPTKKWCSALQVSKIAEAGGSRDASAVPAESTFVCDVCYRPFADSDGLQVHKHVWGNLPCNMNRWQNSIQSRPATVQSTDAIGSGWNSSAGHCDVEIEKRSKAAEECSSSESDTEKYQCCCGKKYCCRGDLARHASRKQQQRHVRLSLDGKKYKCKYCNALFKLSSELLLHKLDCDRRKYRFKSEHTRTGHGPPHSKSFVPEETAGVPVLLSVPVLVNGAFAWGSVVALR